MLKSNLKCVSVSLMLFTFTLSCGSKTELPEKKNDQVDTDSTSVATGQAAALSSQANSTEVANDSLAEIFDNASDAENNDQSDASLTLAPQINVSRSCEQKTDHTLINVEGTYSLSKDFAGPFADWQTNISAKNNTQRKWSQDSQALACIEEYHVVKLPASIEGLKLQIEFARSVEGDITRTPRAAGKKESKIEFNYSAKGSRTIIGTKQTQESGLITRSWDISSKVDRCLSKKNLALRIATSEGKNLQVDVVRNASNGQLASKTVKSGQLSIEKNPEDLVCTQNTADKNSSEKVTVDLSDIKIIFDAHRNCSIKNGKATMIYYKNGTDVAKKIEVVIEDGEATATDLISGEAIDDIRLPICGAFQE